MSAFISARATSDVIRLFRHRRRKHDLLQERKRHGEDYGIVLMSVERGGNRYVRSKIAEAAEYMKFKEEPLKEKAGFKVLKGNLFEHAHEEIGRGKGK